MIDKILVANSGGGQAEEMLKVLLDIPLIQKAQVSLLHVVPNQLSSGNMSGKLEEGAKVLESAMAQLNLPAEQVEPMLRQGDPKTTVCKVANEIDANLIIMGSRGLKRLQSILSNSVSQYVFQLASQPMLLVRDDIYVRKINRVLVALDKSEAAKAALNLTLQMLRDVPGSVVTLLHVDPNLKSNDIAPAGDAAQRDPVLASAVAEATRFGVNYQCVVTGGNPAEQICAVAADKNADLLVLGSPDRRPSIAKALPDIDRLIGSSLSDYVRIKAECPVLLVRTQG
jgi:nucleotide-binding universal stress UspA family protein